MLVLQSLVPVNCPKIAIKNRDENAYLLMEELQVAMGAVEGSTLAMNQMDTVLQGLRASTADGSGGGNSTGVRAYKRFCAMHKRAVLRPVDPNAPLWVKLSEEVWAMRFIAHLVDDRTVSAATARA